MKSISILILTVFASILCRAQHEYDVWYFGRGVGLDFRTNPPTMLEGTPAVPNEGQANYCDPRTGEPLFGCNGFSMYDKNGKIMPNGDGIFAGEGTSSQGAVIIPWPCVKDRYIVVTTDLYGYLRPSVGSSYSVVDMTLNNGLGDVIEKNVLLNPNTDEHLAVTRFGIGNDYWAILHSQVGNTFYAYRITSAGINHDPVISSCGESFLQGKLNAGQIKVSPNGRKLALAAYEQGIIGLFDFNPFTGIVSNPLTIQSDPSRPVYGVGFSPDNSKFYYSSQPPYQYDLSDPDPQAILTSRQAVLDLTTYFNPGDKFSHSMEIGPDGKLYIATWSRWVSVINNPNAKGQLCDYNETQHVSNILFSVAYGLPNNIAGQSIAIPDVLFDITRLPDTVTVDGVSTSLILKTTSALTNLSVRGSFDIDAISLRESSLLRTFSDGTFHLDIPAQNPQQDVKLDIIFNPGRLGCTAIRIDSVLFSGNVLSCNPLTQEIEVCSQCDDQILVSFLKSGEIGNITISPNPASTQLTVMSNGRPSQATIHIFDQMGAIRQENIGDISNENPLILDIRSLPPGFYFMRILTLSNTITIPLLIQK